VMATSACDVRRCGVGEQREVAGGGTEAPLWAVHMMTDSVKIISSRDGVKFT